MTHVIRYGDLKSNECNTELNKNEFTLLIRYFKKIKIDFKVPFASRLRYTRKFL